MWVWWCMAVTVPLKKGRKEFGPGCPVGPNDKGPRGRAHFGVLFLHRAAVAAVAGGRRHGTITQPHRVPDPLSRRLRVRAYGGDRGLSRPWLVNGRIIWQGLVALNGTVSEHTYMPRYLSEASLRGCHGVC